MELIIVIYDIIILERRYVMKKYVCPICGYVYDEEKEGIKFEDLPEDWKCPWCGAPKNLFKAEAQEIIIEENDNSHEEDLREMSYGEISALCSSLARGCEKQYLEEEARLFNKLANYYNEKSKIKENVDFNKLISKINEDIEVNYQKARSIATEKKDRGALRVITWGEKVTLILKALLKQYEQDQNLTKNTKVYVCDICGFIYIGDNKPEICPVCKVPSFKLLEVGRGA